MDTPATQPATHSAPAVTNEQQRWLKLGEQRALHDENELLIARLVHIHSDTCAALQRTGHSVEELRALHANIDQLIALAQRRDEITSRHDVLDRELRAIE